MPTHIQYRHRCLRQHSPRHLWVAIHGDSRIGSGHLWVAIHGDGIIRAGACRHECRPTFNTGTDTCGSIRPGTCGSPFMATAASAQGTCGSPFMATASSVQAPVGMNADPQGTGNLP
jgi:hypothetical protein